MENYCWTPSLFWPEWLTANNTTLNCSAKACATTLTQEQRASNQRPADLYVMNFHVLAGNMLHWNFLRNLKGKFFFVKLGVISTRLVHLILHLEKE